MNKENIFDQLKNNEIRIIQCEAPDLNGVARGVITTTPFFKEGVEKNGFGYVSTMLGGFQTTGEMVDETGLTFDVSFQNGFLKPDLDSFRILPWFDEKNGKTASVLCDFQFEGDTENETLKNIAEASCRQQCKSQLNKLEEMGFKIYSAFEYEFYLVDKQTLQPLHAHNNMYSRVIHNMVRPIISDILHNLELIGITPELYQAEFGHCQQELSIKPKYGISAVDDAFHYKALVKEVALKHNIRALCLSKPFADRSGCSSHFNHSLWNVSDGKNAFFDSEKPDKLSNISKNWLAGLQEHAKGLTALFCITTNCFERCKPMTFAPTNNSWGYDNRTVAFRAKNDSPSHTYLENRIPGAGSNPYLVMTGCLIAGMDGIKRNLQIKSKPYHGNLYKAKELPEGVEHLPENLDEALRHLQDDKILCDELGDVFIKAFVALKKNEIEKSKTFIIEADRFKHYRQSHGLFL